MNKPGILIVEDAPENIEILRTLLADYKLFIATTGERALEIVHKVQPIDLILLDIVLPGIDGLEVCRRIREDQQFNEIPIIFLSGRSDELVVVEGFKAGGQDYVAKPFNPQELISRVNTHLDLRRKNQQLKNLNRSLEKKVQERTAALKEMNEALQKANQQLKNLDLAKSRFLQIISHELRTPLTGILGFTELLELSIGKSSELQEYVQALKQSVERLEDFSQKALFLTELQLNEKNIEPQPLNLLPTFRTLVEEWRPTLNQKKVQLRLEIPPQARVFADYNLLVFCLKTIVGNALQKTKAQSQVVVRFNSGEKWQKLEVEDSGPGFSKEALQFKFQPFALGSEPVDKNFGLDLTTVHLIMLKHRGKMEIGNKNGGGALVQLWFPAKIAG